MYWTTPTITSLKYLRPPPLDTTLPASGEEYIRALKALMHLIHPISAQLLPLFRVYYTLRRSSRLFPQPPYLLSYFDDYDGDEFVLRSLHAHICVLLQEADDHYNDFRDLYGDCGVGEVIGMLAEMDPEERAYCASVPRDWDDFTYLMEDAGQRRFWGWKAKVGGVLEVETGQSTGRARKEKGRKMDRVKSLRQDGK